MYWRQLNENLNVLGIDAWWMDATEPDLHSNLDIDSIKARIGPTAMGPAEKFFNSYPLVHTGGVYEGSRERQPRQARIHPHALGLRGPAAPCRGGVERRHRLALGRSLQPDLRGREHRLLGPAQLDVRHRRLRQRERATARRSPRRRISRNGASSTCAGSSSAHSHRCSARMANSRSAKSSISRRKGRKCSTAWCGTTSCVIACCRTPTRWRRTPSTATAPSCAVSPWTSPMTSTARDVRDEFLFGKAFLVAPVHQHKARTPPGLSTGRSRLV